MKAFNKSQYYVKNTEEKRIWITYPTPFFKACTILYNIIVSGIKLGLWSEQKNVHEKACNTTRFPQLFGSIHI